MNRLISLASALAVCAAGAGAKGQTLPTANDDSFQIEYPQLDRAPEPSQPLNTQLLSPIFPVLSAGGTTNDSFGAAPDPGPALAFSFDLTDQNADVSSAAMQPPVHTLPLPTDGVTDDKDNPSLLNSTSEPSQGMSIPPILFENPVITGRPADQIPIMFMVVGLSIATLSLAAYLLRKVPPAKVRRKGPFDFLPDKASGEAGLRDIWPKR